MPQDPAHWLYRFTPREWIRAAIGELSRAEAAFAQRNRRGGLAGCRRAGGMAVNGMLALGEPPDPRFGRSYMEHLIALQQDERAPEAVRDAARTLVQTPLPGGEIVVLRTVGTDARLVEAARTVMAHALAVVMRSEPLPDEEPRER
jgi:hypothetical protein